MKISISIATIAVLAGITTAQNGLPTCAQSCVTNFTSGSSIGGCNSVDIACICSSSTFLSGIACCLTDKCNAADQQTAVQYAQNLCKVSGVTNLPEAVECSSTASASGTAAASSTSGSASGSAAATTTGSSSSVGASASGSSSSVVAGSATGSSTASSSSTSATGNSAGSQKAVGGVGAGLIGGLAVVAALL